MKKEKLRKLLKLSSTIIGIIILLLIIYIVIKVVIASINGTVPSIFHRYLFVVKTGSMEPTIGINDLVIVKECDISSISATDIISFRCIDASEPIYGSPIVHRVMEVTSEGLTTKGDATSEIDKYLVTSDNFYGKVTFISPFIGKLFTFVTTSYLIVFLIVVIVLLNIIMYEIKKIMNIKKEQLKEEKEKEKEEIRKKIIEELEKEK